MIESVIDGWRIDVGEEAPQHVASAIREKKIGQGSLTVEFENKLAEALGVTDVICTTSGTTALLMAFLAAGVEPGDEVIVPDRTWVATANAALMLGAHINLVDVSPNRPLIDPEKIAAAITSRTKAIVPVHLNGRAADMNTINTIAQRHGLVVIEDACQALFSKYQGQCLGTFGQFGCFSLGLAKVLTTGQGGFIACNSATDAEKLRRIRNQGLGTKDLGEITPYMGGNFKFTDLQAALGLSQLATLPRRLEHQKQLAQDYVRGLENISWLQWVKVDLDAGEIPLRTEYLCSRREPFIQAMKLKGIGVTAMTPSLHEYPHLKSKGYFPNSKKYGPTLLTLPSGPEQPLENVSVTIQAIKQLDRAGVFASGTTSNKY